MKTTFNKSAFVFLLLLSFSVARAENLNKTSELAFGFSLFNFSENKESDISADVPFAEEATVVDDLAVAENLIKNACEHYDSAVTNLLNLETASANSRQKIENVEETLESESALRDSIFDSVKNFLGLQKKDKVIFREMKKDLSDAKSYYDTLDQKIDENSGKISETDCELVKLEIAKKIDVDTQDMVEDESTFRKQFVASLKEKMKILQDSIKEAKK